MRGAWLAFTVLAGVAGAQAPVIPAVRWDEAQLTWPASDQYANGGGTLADPSGVLYIVEASAPGGNGWGPIAVVATTTYRVTGLWPGLWQFRVKAFLRLTGYSVPGPIASKTVVLPVLSAPPTDTVQ